MASTSTNPSPLFHPKPNHKSGVPSQSSHFRTTQPHITATQITSPDPTTLIDTLLSHLSIILTASQNITDIPSFANLTLDDDEKLEAERAFRKHHQKQIDAAQAKVKLAAEFLKEELEKMFVEMQKSVEERVLKKVEERVLEKVMKRVELRFKEGSSMMMIPSHVGDQSVLSGFGGPSAAAMTEEAEFVQYIQGMDVDEAVPESPSPSQSQSQSQSPPSIQSQAIIQDREIEEGEVTEGVTQPHEGRETEFDDAEVLPMLHNSLTSLFSQPQQTPGNEMSISPHLLNSTPDQNRLVQIESDLLSIKGTLSTATDLLMRMGMLENRVERVEGGSYLSLVGIPGAGAALSDGTTSGGSSGRNSSGDGGVGQNARMDRFDQKLTALKNVVGILAGEFQIVQSKVMVLEGARLSRSVRGQI